MEEHGEILFFGNFDHIGSALLILFEISTLEMWPNIMYHAVDRDNQPQYALYMFVGVVVDHFRTMTMGTIKEMDESIVYQKPQIINDHMFTHY